MFWSFLWCLFALYMIRSFFQYQYQKPKQSIFDFFHWLPLVLTGVTVYLVGWSGLFIYIIGVLLGLGDSAHREKMIEQSEDDDIRRYLRQIEIDYIERWNGGIDLQEGIDKLEEIKREEMKRSARMVNAAQDNFGHKAGVDKMIQEKNRLMDLDAEIDAIKIRLENKKKSIKS